VWFFNRECQVAAKRQGHSGADCRPDGATGAEVAPRSPVAAGPSATAPGVDPSLAASSCHACGKSEGKLLCCGRCKNVWFCNRECQEVARKDLGHKGANCRPADHALANPGAARSKGANCRPADHELSSVDQAKLVERFEDLTLEAYGLRVNPRMANTRLGSLAEVRKVEEAAAVADLIGGKEGAMYRARTYYKLSTILLNSGDTAAAARAACTALCAERATYSMTALVRGLSVCADVATEAPAEMAKAEIEGHEQEGIFGSPSYGLALKHVGRISLPTTPAAVSRLSLAYREAAVTVCDTALTVAGGRDTPAADDDRRVPSLSLEAATRSDLAHCLFELGEERQRVFGLYRQAVALLRQAVRTMPPGADALEAKRALASELVSLGVVGLEAEEGDACLSESEACLREALELSEETDDKELKRMTLSSLANMSGKPEQPVLPAGAAAFRARLNELSVQMGRSPDTNCAICLEPLETLEQPGGPEQGGRAADGNTDSFVYVLKCGHQFHTCCLRTWWSERPGRVCLMCRT